MEEDIKILEELTEEYNSQHYMDMPLINGKQIQALENLLKGYRELEEKNKLINVRIKTKLRIAQENYERYEKEDEQRLALIQCGKVGVLQELMEDK